VRGTPESLHGKFPDDVIEGIMLHRAVDAFTDSHSIFLEAKHWLQPERKKLAGIVIDVFFDHFLACHWKKYSRQKLERFISEIHLLLERRADWLPPELQALVPRMEAENWLGNYQDLDDLAVTFQRISKRRKFLTPLVGAEQDLKLYYNRFEKAFSEYYPQVLKYAENFSWSSNE